MYLDYDLTFRIQRYEYANHVTTTPRVDPSETGRPRAGDRSRLTRARRGFDRSIDSTTTRTTTRTRMSAHAMRSRYATG